MKLNKLVIKNFRNLLNFTISFDKRLTVLVANNSAGKTSILDAISIVFGSYIGNFPTEKNNGFKFTDATIINKGDEPEYPVSVNADILLKPDDRNYINIYRELASKGSRTTVVDTKKLQDFAKDSYEKLRNKEDVNLPIVAYYGTGRLYKITKSSKDKYQKEQSARSYGYHNCLNPNSNYKEFREWFKEQSQIEINFIRKSLQEKSVIDISKAPNAKILKSVRESVDIVLKHLDWKDLSFNGEELVVQNSNDIDIAVDSLSDGVKNMLTLVADIAYRCVKLNPHLDNPIKDTQGIILIDEIEMHLHPSWQQRVISDLINLFENTQFIITTHSPQVLSSIDNESIRIIDPSLDESIVPNINPYGKQSIVALEDIMNVSSTPPKEIIKEVDILENYLEIINNGDINNPNLKEMRKVLDKTYGENYSKLLIADMLINKYKAKV